MKIAFILNQFPVLSETFILNQMTGLLDLGHDVRIFAHTDPQEPKVHPDVAKYDLLGRTVYIRRGAGSKRLCLLKALCVVLGNLANSPREMCRFTKMFIGRRKGLSLERLYLLLAFIDANVDIVQCHYGPVGAEGVFLKDAGIRAKICTVFHGFDVSGYPLTHGGDVYDELFAKGDLFMPISEYWKKVLGDLGCPVEKTVVHRMGIELDKFEYADHGIRSDGPVRLLTVGRLVQKKGHRYAIEAVADLVDAGRDIEYTIAGDGPLRAELEGLAESGGLGDRMRFLGAVDADQVRGLYRESDIFVLPSVIAADGDMEGIPVVLMEAMACGLPVVSTRHSGIGELVVDGESGLLAKEKDVDGLAAKVRQLIDKPEMYIRMARCAVECVRAGFDVEKLNGELEEKLSRLAAVINSNK